MFKEKAFIKYYHEASEQYKKKRNQYLMDSIQAIYADLEDEDLTGRAVPEGYEDFSLRISKKIQVHTVCEGLS